MSRSNVKSVLVTSGNAAALAAGSKCEDLAVGQVGVFDAETNLAIDATSTPKDFYIAVGIDAHGDGTMNDIKESAGQLIQSANLRGYSWRAHTAAQPMIVALTGVANVEVGKEYAIKLEFRNEKIFRLQGTNQFTHTYAVVSNTNTANGLMAQFIEAVNANPDGFVEAVATYTATEALTVAGGYTIEYVAGDPITVQADIDLATTEGKIAVAMQLTTKAISPNRALNLNLKYYDFRQTVVIPSLVEGFGATAAFETVQEIAYEEGDGNQIRQLEYHQNNTAHPYVLSEATGTAMPLVYHADGSVNYDQLILEYDQFSVAGWLEHLNNLQTTIAIPATDTTTRDSIVPIIDAQFAAQGFTELAEKADDASTDPEVVEPSNVEGVIE